MNANMPIIEDKVQDFFNNTKNYLYGNSTILLRKYIVSEIINNVNDCEIIDVGCGNGIISIPYLESNKVTFLDLSKNMLDETKKNVPENLINNAKFHNTSIEKYVPDKNFDIVLLLGVLAHVENIETCIMKIAEISNNNCICIVQITNYDKLLAKILRAYSVIKKSIIKPMNDYDTNIMYRDSIVNIFLKFGFSLVDEKPYLPTFPGFRFLKQETRTKFLMKTYKSMIAKNIGSELLLKFKKVK